MSACALMHHRHQYYAHCHWRFSHLGTLEHYQYHGSAHLWSGKDANILVYLLRDLEILHFILTKAVILWKCNYSNDSYQLPEVGHFSANHGASLHYKWKIAVNVLNKKFQIAGKGWSSISVNGWRSNDPSSWKLSMLLHWTLDFYELLGMT